MALQGQERGDGVERAELLLSLWECGQYYESWGGSGSEVQDLLGCSQRSARYAGGDGEAGGLLPLSARGAYSDMDLGERRIFADTGETP